MEGLGTMPHSIQHYLHRCYLSGPQSLMLGCSNQNCTLPICTKCCYACDIYFSAVYLGGVNVGFAMIVNKRLLT